MHNQELHGDMPAVNYIKIINLFIFFFPKTHSFVLRHRQVCSVPLLFCAVSKTCYIHLTKKIRTWSY